MLRWFLLFATSVVWATEVAHTEVATPLSLPGHFGRCIMCEACETPLNNQTWSFFVSEDHDLMPCFLCPRGYNDQDPCVCNGCPGAVVPDADEMDELFGAVPWPIDRSIPGAGIVAAVLGKREFHDFIRDIPWRGIGVCDAFMHELQQLGNEYKLTPLEKAAETQCLKQRAYLVGISQLLGFDGFLLPMELATSIESWFRLAIETVRGLWIYFQKSQKGDSHEAIWAAIRASGTDPMLVYKILQTFFDGFEWFTDQFDVNHWVGSLRSIAEESFGADAETNPLSALTLALVHTGISAVRSAHIVTTHISNQFQESNSFYNRTKPPQSSGRSEHERRLMTLAEDLVEPQHHVVYRMRRKKTRSLERNAPIALMNTPEGWKENTRTLLAIGSSSGCRSASVLAEKIENVFAAVGKYYMTRFPESVRSFNQYNREVTSDLSDGITFEVPEELATNVQKLYTAKNETPHEDSAFSTNRLLREQTHRGLVGTVLTWCENWGFDVVDWIEDWTDRAIQWIRGARVELCPYEKIMLCTDKRRLDSSIVWSLLVAAIATVAITIFIPTLMPFAILVWINIAFIIGYLAYGYTPFCFPMLPTCLADDIMDQIYRPIVSGSSYWMVNLLSPSSRNMEPDGGYAPAAFVRCLSPPYHFYDGVNSIFFYMAWQSPELFETFRSSKGAFSVVRDFPPIDNAINAYANFTNMSENEKKTVIGCFRVTSTLLASAILMVSLIVLTCYSTVNFVFTLSLCLGVFLWESHCFLTTLISFYQARALPFRFPKTPIKEHQT